MKEVNYEGITQPPQEFLRNRTLMCSLGKAEAEEVLGRILRFSLQENQWVVPTAQEIDSQVKSDFAKIREADEIHQRNRMKQREYERMAKWNWFRRLFGKEVREPEYEEEKEKPFTLLDINPNAIIIGVHYMQEHGFLEINEENGEIFLKVTEKALSSMPVVC
jgi:hypothetical protein